MFYSLTKLSLLMKREKYNYHTAFYMFIYFNTEIATLEVKHVA